MHTPVFPEIVFAATCPRCQTSVNARDWVLPGMWTMGQFECGACGCRFLTDLPYSLGVVGPCTLQEDTGVATSTKTWYANAIAHAHSRRVATPVRLTVERSPSDCHCLLVNTLYPWYGDAVSLLLRINALRGAGAPPVVVLINRALAWLVPDWVAGVWVAEISFAENGQWNDALTRAIKAQAAEHRLSLSIPSTFQPFHITSQELTEFTRIAPFPRERWLERLKDRPVVTFQWRTDRVWSEASLAALENSWFIKSRFAARFWRHLKFDPLRWMGQRQQCRRLVQLANGLRAVFPNLEFAVSGLDRRGTLPGWIKDLRVDVIDDDTNRRWAEQAARSHVLIGMLGSHTVLPGSLAGAYIELVPGNLIPNVLTTVSVRSREAREAIFTHRVLSSDIRVDSLKSLIIQILCDYPYIALAMSDRFYGPLEPAQLETIRDLLAERTRVIESISGLGGSGLAN